MTSAAIFKLFTVGYGRWSAATRSENLLATLGAAGVELLVDIRHSPCSSNLNPDHHYGPRDWHIQSGNAGIVPLLKHAGIGYLWLVELGNPQKQDHAMMVLREQLADPKGGWPVHRGLERLLELARDERRVCCLMCACDHYEGCHRRLVAEALSSRFPTGRCEITDLSR